MFFKSLWKWGIKNKYIYVFYIQLLKENETTEFFYEMRGTLSVLPRLDQIWKNKTRNDTLVLIEIWTTMLKICYLMSVDLTHIFSGQKMQYYFMPF